MNKKHEPSVILKTLILIFCIINVIALFLVLKHEKQTQNNAQVISYDVTEEETEEETTSSQVPSPSLPSHACRKLVHSAARPCPVKARFAGNPYSAAAPSAARSRSAWVPTLRRLRISPLAPLRPGRPSSPPLPIAPLPSREPACVTHRLRRLRRSSTPADSLSVRSASAVARRACPGLRLLRATSGYSLRRLRQNPFRAHSAPPARTGAGSLRFRLRATCPFTPAGSWRSAGSTASLRRPFPGQIATPARFPARSAQPARPLPSSSGAPQAAQPSCGVRSRAD